MRQELKDAIKKLVDSGYDLSDEDQRGDAEIELIEMFDYIPVNETYDAVTEYMNLHRIKKLENPLRKIYENKQRIKELEAEIKAIETENQKCLEYALLKGITERGEYKIRTVVTPRREPIPEKVWALCGEDARKYATFQIKGLEKILSAVQIDSVCKVNESVKRVVEMIEG